MAKEMTNELEKISISQMKDLIKFAVTPEAKRLRFVPFFRGRSGIGKTQGAEQAAEELDAHLVTVLLGQYDTVDLKGTPWVGEDDETGYKSTVWHPASTLPFEGNSAFPEDKPIILFLDEATSATVPVLGILYQLSDKGCIGEHKLKSNVTVVLAGNLVSDKGIVNRMPLPLLSRLTQFEAEVLPEEWMDYAAKAGLPDVGIAWIGFQKKHLHNFDPKNPEEVSASPRTVERALRLYGSELPKDLKRAAMVGSIGAGPVTEFYGFIDVWQEVMTMMPAIRKRPEEAKVPTELSFMYALSVAISGELKNDSSAINLWKYLQRLDAEFVILAMNMATTRDGDMFESPVFLEYSRKYKQIFQNH